MDSEEAHIKKAYCKHAFAASILQTKENMKTEIFYQDIDQVFLLQENPFPILIVYPQTRKSNSKGKHILPGVVIRTAKLSKHRCKTCKGRDGCVHLNIFKLAQSENGLVDEFGSMRLLEKNKKTNTKTDMVENDVNLKTKPEVGPRSKTKVVNLLNPQNFHGPEVNVFKQSFNYPPSKENREKNYRMNKEET